MKTSELDYHLPNERIAQRSVSPRDTSKLLVFDCAAQQAEHEIFKDIAQYLRRGDVLVFNNTKVFRARLRGMIGEHEAEVLLLRPHMGAWMCLGKPGKRLQVGVEVVFSKIVRGFVAERFDNGQFVMKFENAKKKMTDKQVIAFANKQGEIPLPPYVANGPTKISEYQTVYAKHVGSVAAPTAGFHFTRALRARLKKMGVQFVEVTLHVGIGTFQPIKTDDIESHVMHGEMVGIGVAESRKIARAKKEGRRVIAVGTTTTRALEGSADEVLAGKASCKDVNMFINPGYQFRVIDGLVTNFHLPKSTLMLLVGALLQQKTGNDGVQVLKRLYTDAIGRSYRFYSFGDAMFIL